MTHYFLLILILSIGLVSILTFRFHPPFAPLSIIITALAYVIWGIVHHALTRSLHRQVVLEYVSLALLGALIIYILL